MSTATAIAVALAYCAGCALLGWVALRVERRWFR